MKGAFPTGTDIANPAQSKTPRFIPPTVEELAPRFPQLEILEFLGQGGMGAVYKVRQKHLDRIVALKILPPETACGVDFAERFAREAKALAKLNHPGIVTLYEFGQAAGLFFFLMEFMDGFNLRKLLNTRRVTPKEALAIVPQICNALQFAHDHGVVHRDIKPENILLNKEGQVKIADFGVARIVAPGVAQASPEQTAGAPPSGLTEACHLLGTLQYMSPEQKEHPEAVDHRADIYALGVVFYQMLTGELPGQRLEPPSKKVQIDVRFDEVVLRALERNPELRFQRVSQLKTAVETISGAGTQLPSGDRSSVRQRVKWPAIGLIVSSLFSPVIPVLIVALGEIKPAVWMFLPLASMLVLITVAIRGGIHMLRLRSYRTASAGIIAAIVLTVFGINIVGPPTVVWAAFVLWWRREVRLAFAETGLAASQHEEVQTGKPETGVEAL